MAKIQTTGAHIAGAAIAFLLGGTMAAHGALGTLATDQIRIWDGAVGVTADILNGTIDALYTRQTDGTNVMPMMDAVGRAGFQKLTDGVDTALVSASGALSVEFVGGIGSDTELPAAAALADAFSNPTVPGVGAFGMLWNGTNWDRWQGTTANGAEVDVTRVSGTVTIEPGGTTSQPIRPTRAAPTDASGTTSGTPSTSTTLVAADANRNYLFVQNVGTAAIWINIRGAAAVATTPSIRLDPTASFVMEGSAVSTSQVNVLSGTASVPFTALVMP